MSSVLKHPSAWLPIAMSLAVIAMEISVFSYMAAIHAPIVRQSDEGVVAHLFQILMGGQIPVIAFFAVKFLPEKPKQASIVLALQLLAGLAACFPVWYFHL